MFLAPQLICFWFVALGHSSEQTIPIFETVVCHQDLWHRRLAEVHPRSEYHVIISYLGCQVQNVYANVCAALPIGKEVRRTGAQGYTI